MRPRRLSVHVCRSNRPVDLTLLHQFSYVFKTVDYGLGFVLQKDSFFGVLANLKLGLLRNVQEIENLLVVNLSVRASDRD